MNAIVNETFSLKYLYATIYYFIGRYICIYVYNEEGNNISLGNRHAINLHLEMAERSETMDHSKKETFI
jgi:hypothetical protein